MKFRKYISLTYLLFFVFKNSFLFASTPDSAYIFAYSTVKSNGHSGLCFAWSLDKQKWNPIGPEHRFLFCDYGTWGAEKRMVSPCLFLDKNNTWHCVWSVNEYDNVFAHAYSYDLIYWFPQIYPKIAKKGNFLLPEINFDEENGNYGIYFLSDKNSEKQSYKLKTNDFKTFGEAEIFPESLRLNSRKVFFISGEKEAGTVHRVSWNVIDNLIKTSQFAQYKNKIESETTKDDTVRFAGLKPMDAKLIINPNNTKKISDKLIGVFFEDINYAADGGLYAELIQNRDFEYDLSDKKGRDKTWTHQKSWTAKNMEFTIDSISPIHVNNKYYAVLNFNQSNSTLSNEGFDGICIKNGDKYDVSFFARNSDKKSKKIQLKLIDKDGKIYAEAVVNVNSSHWKKYISIITASKTIENLQLQISSQTFGKLNLDMISLFPQKTFKNRKNGLRPDLAQSIADIHPKFVRFPGGCVSHGDGISNIYRWKNTIGNLEERKPMRNIWNYHQSLGLGYFEYFQFCEDIGAEPLPVIAAGVPCQNSSSGGAGQQGGIPMCEMDNYVQDILDLIEWANGNENTKWGKIRAKSGHPKPFNLKYIGIGNEDLINDIFEERFTKIYSAIKEKYPQIIVIGTVGPFSEGTDYVEGWKIADKLHVPMVDEHYYQPPGWFINNADFYDKYDRNKPKVYLGEYAAHLQGRPNNVETAITEALYLTSLERNGDVVSMASYAPMLAKEGHTQWNPNLIYFNNTEVKPTVGYYVQQLFGQNSGDIYVLNGLELSNKDEKVRKQVAASVVKDSKTGDLIVKLVNILPVKINTKMIVFNQNLQSEGIKTVLSGNPTDKTVEPQTSKIDVKDPLNCQLNPYSLTIIRLKNR